jgi:hypothetical protein
MKKEMLVVPIPAFLVVIFLFPLSLVTAAVEEDSKPYFLFYIDFLDYSFFHSNTIFSYFLKSPKSY